MFEIQKKNRIGDNAMVWVFVRGLEFSGSQIDVVCHFMNHVRNRCIKSPVIGKNLQAAIKSISSHMGSIV